MMKGTFCMLLLYHFLSFGNAWDSPILFNSKHMARFLEPESLFLKFSSLNDTQCSKDMKTVLNGAVFKHMWALQLLDATARIPSGVTRGNRVWFGSYENCLDASGSTKAFSGKHCMVDINITSFSPISNNQPTFQWAFCVPSSCSVNQLNHAFEAYRPVLLEGDLRSRINLQTTEQACDVKDIGNKFTATNLKTMWIIGTLLLLTSLATYYDIWWQRSKKRNDKMSPFWSSISIRTNWNYLTTVPNSNALSGMRTITILLIMLGQVGLMVSKNGLTSNDFYQQQNPHQIFTIYAFDTLFILQSMALVQAVFSELQKSGVYDLPLAIITKYLRSIIGILFLVVIRLGISEHLGSGPIFHMSTLNHQLACLNNLKSILMMRVPLEDQCLADGWYLSADFRFFVLSHVYFYVLFKKPRIGVILIGVSAITSTLITTYNESGLSGDGALGIVLFQLGEFLRYTTPGLIGLLFGYALHCYKTKTFEVSKIGVISWWILSIAALLFITLGSKTYETEKMNQEHVAIFWGLSRIFWSLLIGWIVFACETENGGILGKILAWQPFNVFAKISFEFYLFAPFVLQQWIALARETIYLDNLVIVYHFIPLSIITVLGSYPMALLVTVPCKKLVRYLCNNISVLPIQMGNSKEDESKVKAAKKANGKKNQ